MDTARDAITDLYTYLLERAPDAAGAAFWRAKRAEGLAMWEIVAQFVAAARASGLHGLDRLPPAVTPAPEPPRAEPTAQSLDGIRLGTLWHPGGRPETVYRIDSFPGGTVRALKQQGHGPEVMEGHWPAEKWLRQMHAFEPGLGTSWRMADGRRVRCIARRANLAKLEAIDARAEAGWQPVTDFGPGRTYLAIQPADAPA